MAYIHSVTDTPHSIPSEHYRAADSISTLAEVSARRKVSITFLRKEIERGRLRAVVLAPDSHRKKVRIFYRDEIAWLESNFA
jgi:hypothetical protein